MKIAIVLVLLACATCILAFDSAFLAQPVHDMTLINKINTTPRVSWKATTYPQFEGKTLADIRNMLGAVLVQKGTADRIPKLSVTPRLGAPTAFDARTKWPTCVHPIRNQEVCNVHYLF